MDTALDGGWVRSVKWDELALPDEPVASGASGQVYRGRLGGEWVAVRVARITSQASLERFHAELAVHRRLWERARGSEALSGWVGLLPLVAVCQHPPHYATVFPWYREGSLFDLLHADELAPRFTEARVLPVALQLARGLRTLHRLGLVHRDVKSSNVLLDGERVALADYELTEATAEDEDDEESRTGPAAASTEAWRSVMSAGRAGPSAGRLQHMVGTMVYMAPELLVNTRDGRRYRNKADVYAYAITLNEMISGCVPYVDRRLAEPELHTVLETRFNELQLRTAIVKEHLRPSMNVEAVERIGGEALRQLIEAAWHADPRQRPDFEHIVARLESIQRWQSPGRMRSPRMTVPDGFAMQLESAAPATTAAEARGAIRLDELLRVYFPDDAAAYAQRAERLARYGRVSDAEQRHSTQAVHDAPAALAKGAHSGCGGALSYADVYATAGRRGADRMEDRHFIRSPLVLDEHATSPRPLHLLGVLDGHGGQSAAAFVAVCLPEAIREELQRIALPTMDASAVRQALQQAFMLTDLAWLLHSASRGREWRHSRRQQDGGRGTIDESGDHPLSGCTALVALVDGNTVHVANAGDSRAVLYSRCESVSETSNPPLRGTPLSTDMTCDGDATERRRLERLDARLVPLGGQLRVEGQVVVTRALGDRALKRYITARPQVQTVDLHPRRDRFLVLATDGLWDVLDEPQTGNILHGTVGVAGLMARRLAQEALQRGSLDNITVVVACLRDDTFA